MKDTVREMKLGHRMEREMINGLNPELMGSPDGRRLKP